MTVAAKRWFITGRVQGVGFRAFVQRMANRLGVTGYTRNLEDGRVEVYGIGSARTLSEFAGHLHKGPPMSDVRHVDEREAELIKLEGFRVEH
ncbi:MAG TPA: acylphosphatase [Bryobacteraceae bacterium]|jgi:acylphosphatase|nr:acylphosphatase [Bryobacteraceae bacterium]